MRSTCILLLACLACGRQSRVSRAPVLAEDLTSLGALTGLGDTYALAGDYTAAIRVYERLLASSRSKPDSVQALLRIAEAQTFAGNFTGAETTLVPGIQLARSAKDPALEYVVVSRINALQRWNGRLAEAETTIAMMERVGTHPSLPEATRRANALRTLQLLAMVDAKRGDVASARRRAEEYVLRRAEAGLPSQREMTLGLVAIYLGHHSQAVEFLERAPEKESMSYLQYWLGVAHEALGHHEKAQEYFERVSNWSALTPVDRLQLPLVRDLAKRKLSRKR